MDTALPLPLVLAELTSDTMSELSTTARLLWLILSSAPTEEPLRLNVPRLRLTLSAAFDHDATRSDVELAVLTLEDRGLIVTSVGQAGRERYRLGQRPPVSRRARPEPSTASSQASGDPSTASQSSFIGTVGRESEKEGERESERAAPHRPRPALAPPPTPFCPDHMPMGSGGVPCVVCADHTRAMKFWDQNRIHADDWDGQPHPQSPTPPSWQRDQPSPPAPEQPPLFGRRPRFHPSDETDPGLDPDDIYNFLTH